LIHGSTDFSLSWSPQLSALVHAGYRVILPDLHGHGGSQPATAFCTLDNLATDVAALLDHIGAEPTGWAEWSHSRWRLTGRILWQDASWRTRVLAAGPGSSFCHVAQGMTHVDLPGGLATIRVQALLIVGEHDRLFSPDDTRKTGNEIAGSTCAVIAAAAHLSNLDSRDQFNRLLLDFLASHFTVL
jgi:pimeloyl-ACP methyl ester carboxylesterase